MKEHSKITDQHRREKAYVYVRQSTLSQVMHHQESTSRQYALKDKALLLGWRPSQIRTLDGDLGMSGARSDEREDFKTLLADVSLGEVGAVLALEASRLARSNTDWYRLIEICSLTGTLIIDEDGVYDPADFNDALLLGIKGTMSSAEIHFLRARMLGGRRNKAKRGELRFRLPIGFCWENDATIVLDPDLEVQNAVRNVFRFFEETGSAYGVTQRFAKEGLKFPKRAYGGAWDGKLIWGHLTSRRVPTIIKNPAYAGAYVFGRLRCVKEILQDGRVRQRMKEMPRDSWLVEIQDHHEGYVSWEQYLANIDQLQRNRVKSGDNGLAQSAREGLAILQGLLICSQCGRRLTIRYQGKGGIHPIYECWAGRQDKKSCLRISSDPLDKALTQRLLELFNTDQLRLALAAQDELIKRDATIRRQWEMRLERARYEANLAQRRYEQVDPENRLVASSLEQRWNTALEHVDDVQHQMDEFGRRQTRTFTPDQRERIIALARDFPRLWNSSAISMKDRKRMLRLLVEDITVRQHEGRTVILHTRWTGGACEDLAVELPVKYERLRCPQEVINEVKRLATAHDDEDIAAMLNASGLKNLHGRPFIARMIKWSRYKYKLQAPKLKRSDEFTVTEVARRFGVAQSVVHYWIQRKVIPTRRHKPSSPHWITITPEIDRKLTEWIQRSTRIKKLT